MWLLTETAQHFFLKKRLQEIVKQFRPKKKILSTREKKKEKEEGKTKRKHRKKGKKEKKKKKNKETKEKKKERKVKKGRAETTNHLRMYTSA